MKLTNLPKYFLFFLIGIFFFSCKEDESQELLQKAQSSLAENQPDVALNIITSIRNPQSMSESDYMQYIVTYVGAKQETKADIVGDTLIFEAQKYFRNKKDLKNSALANYYAAWVYYTNNNFPKALEFFMYATNEAENLNDNVLAGRSLNNIGYIYCQQELYDNSLISYKRALSFYDKVENTEERKMKTLTNIGRVYEEDNKLDSAYLYFNKALENATKSGDEQYKSHSLKNLGVVCYGMGEYKKAIDYLQSALAMNITGKPEIKQISLYLLNSYNKTHDLESAKQYADSVIASIPEVTYNYTIKEMYEALADYYQQSGDYKQALEYRNLESETKKQIKEEENAPALLAADKKFHLEQQAREDRDFNEKMFMLVIIVGIGLIVSLFFIFLARRSNKKDEAIIQQQVDKINEMRKTLAIMREESIRNEAEIKAMLEDEAEKE